MDMKPKHIGLLATSSLRPGRALGRALGGSREIIQRVGPAPRLEPGQLRKPR